MAKKDLVAEFKKKVHQIEELTGFKYKILYRDYKGALENGRLHVYWHKPCKLAEVTTPEGKVTFEVAGEFDADLMSPEGLICNISGQLKPMTPFDTTTVDAVGISHDGISIDNDKDVIKYSDPDSEWRFEFNSVTYVQAVFGDKTYMFDDPSIAKAIFDVNAIKELTSAVNDVANEEPAAKEEIVEKPEKKAEVSAKTKEAELPVEEEKPSVEEPEVIEEPKEAEAPAPKKPARKTTKKVKAEEKEQVEERKGEQMATIKDSGQRTQFASGAVRDVQKGKGRCDLLPLDIVGEYFECTPDKSGFEEISLFQTDHDRSHLIKAAKAFAKDIFPDDETTILEYACHLEDGCNKYGDRNWEKGIPLSRYIDSGIRHYLKYRRGDDDERHDRAFIWNMLCGAWTCKHHPELVEE